MAIMVERAVQAFRWKLDWGVDAPALAEERWKRYLHRDRKVVIVLAKALVERFGLLFADALRVRAGLAPPPASTGEDLAMMAEFANEFCAWLHGDPGSRVWLDRKLEPLTGSTSHARERVEVFWSRLGVVQTDLGYDAVALKPVFARLCTELGRRFAQALDVRLAGGSLETAWLRPIASRFADWVKQEPARSIFVARVLHAVIRPRLLRQRRVEVPAARSLSLLRPAPPAPSKSAPPRVAPSPPAPAPQPAAQPAAVPSPIVAEAVVPPAAPVWHDLPVEDAFERHDESYACALTGPGVRLIGARVRGKKHKHEGTNCDDWFELAKAGPWSILVASDGAGSKRFSRIGAKAACRAASALLAQQLESHVIRQEQWAESTFERDGATGAFKHPELAHVGQALVASAQAGLAAIDALASARAHEPAYTERLGRPLEANDMSCTLVMAVHCRVRSNGGPRAFGMGCQIGDGMGALVMEGGRLQLLGTPDSGQFSGETEFLTSRRRMEPTQLWARVIPFLAPLQALLVMTDGVADDYFPNDPELLRLYGDLVLNGIAPARAGALPEIEARLGAQGLPDVVTLSRRARCTTRPYKDSDGVPRTALLRSFADYQQALAIETSSIVASPAVLAAGALGPSLCDAEAVEERLRVWLDSYHVRGSFDDRTLVALFPED